MIRLRSKTSRKSFTRRRVCRQLGTPTFGRQRRVAYELVSQGCECRATRGHGGNTSFDGHSHLSLDPIRHETSSRETANTPNVILAQLEDICPTNILEFISVSMLYALKDSRSDGTNDYYSF